MVFQKCAHCKAVFSPVQELGIDKAVHQIKLRQALKIIIGKRTSQPPCELSSSDHDTTAINTSTKMTFKIIPSDSDTIV